MNLCQKTYLLTNNLTICLIIMEINICEVRFALVCLYCLSILLFILFKIHVIRPVLNRIDILVETTVTDIQG